MPGLAGAQNVAETFRRFVTTINEHDVAALGRMLAADHEFKDSLGRSVRGASSMEAGWRGYFAMCPDYWIRVDRVMAEGETVLATGEAGGTIDGEPWRVPAAWRAAIRDGAIEEWQVFADNKPVYEILGKRARG